VNPLKSLTNSYAAYDGQVVFHLLPFRSIRCEVAIETLERIEPQWRYRNSKTGEINPVAPEGWEAAAKMAAEFGTTPLWIRERLWDIQHDTFALVLPLALEIEFHLTDTSPAELRGLQVYWENQTADARANWELFNQVLTVDVLVQIWVAYKETRQKSLDLPVELIADEIGATPSPEA
jgi:hypothetical protein